MHACHKNDRHVLLRFLLSSASNTMAARRLSQIITTSVTHSVLRKPDHLSKHADCTHGRDFGLVCVPVNTGIPRTVMDNLYNDLNWTEFSLSSDSCTSKHTVQTEQVIKIIISMNTSCLSSCRFVVNKHSSINTNLSVTPDPFITTK